MENLYNLILPYKIGRTYISDYWHITTAFFVVEATF
jgi:hypothetical protein